MTEQSSTSSTIKRGDRVRSATFEDTGKVVSAPDEEGTCRVDLDTFAFGGSSIVALSADDLTRVIR